MNKINGRDINRQDFVGPSSSKKRRIKDAPLFFMLMSSGYY